MQLSSVIKLMRPHQYVKNLFILFPLFFALKIDDSALLFNALLAFAAFSLTASAIYILNDYHDIEEDRQHPTKKERPLASGAVGKTEALLLTAGLLAAGFSLMASLSLPATAILALYTLLNVAYSFALKHIAIIDVVIIAVGFVLRLFVGGAVTGVPLSMWIIMMTFLLALFMALAKRRDDVLIYNNTGRKMRRVIDGYNLQFLDTAMSIMGAVVIVAYTIYTTSAEVVQRLHSDHLYLTTLFVIIGILRYLQIAFVHLDSGSPTKIVLTDRFMQLTLLGWIVTFIWILY